MTVRIRRGVADDARALAELAAITFPLATPSDTDPDAIVEFVRTKLSEDRFVEHLAHPERVVLVAEAGATGDVVGYAILIPGEPTDAEVQAAVATRPTVDLNKFYLHPDHHGSGTAAVLMAAAVDEARAAGAGSLWLGVNNENVRANRFYEKEGFAIVGTKHFLLGDRLEDDFVRERLV